MINKQKQIEGVYTSIRNDWTVDHYSTCTSAWAKIKSFISKEPTPYQCGDCKTYWTKITYVNDHYNVCPNCDTYWEPFLCNPVNWISVLEYIDPKYHHYLIPNRKTISFLQYIKDDNDITDKIGLIGDDFTAFLEGITLKEIRQVHILEPTWNMSSINQIIGRAVRNYSHQLLDQNERNVEIYKYASVYKDSFSIDKEKYILCSEKDKSNKVVERLLKTIAFDCYLNKSRNLIKNGVKGSAECDYTDCDYKCTDIDNDYI